METQKPPEKQSKGIERKYVVFAARIIGDFGATIAIPVVVLVLAGRWLDGRYGTQPWCMIGGFLLAALISGRMIYKKAKKLGKEFQDL